MRCVLYVCMVLHNAYIVNVLKESHSRVRLSLMAQPVCVWRTPQVLIVLYLQLAINTYMELFTINSKLKVRSETATVRLVKKGIWLAGQTEDADGVHIVDACFEGLSAEIMQLARTLCATRRQSAFSIYTKINTRIWLFP